MKFRISQTSFICWYLVNLSHFLFFLSIHESVHQARNPEVSISYLYPWTKSLQLVAEPCQFSCWHGSIFGGTHHVRALQPPFMSSMLTHLTQFQWCYRSLSLTRESDHCCLLKTWLCFPVYFSIKIEHQHNICVSGPWLVDVTIFLYTMLY